MFDGPWVAFEGRCLHSVALALIALPACAMV
jgi:hypothetical protein